MTGTAVFDGFVPWPPDFVDRYVSAGYWHPETLGGLLRKWAGHYAGRTALVAGDERLTYAELDRRTDLAAAGFVAAGLAPGDRVVVQLPNNLDFMLALFGLTKAGGVPVLALPAHRRIEISHLANLSGAVGYLAPDQHEGFDYRQLAEQVRSDAASLTLIAVAGEPGGFRSLRDVLVGEGSTEPEQLSEVDPAGVAVLLVSGGTTGKPKLIPRTHRDYAYNARASAEVCALTADDVYLVCLPAAHNFPLACPGILGILGVGGTTVMSSAPTPDLAFALIDRERVTVTALVPPLVRFWLDAAGWDPRDRSSLRLLQVGGAKLDPVLAARVRPGLGCALQQVFGMAEGLLNYTRLDEPDDIICTTQGRPLSPADEVVVVDGAGKPVADGEVGELWTRGPYTLRGYYRAGEYNATAFSGDGFYCTGDLVRQLPSGHLIVEGRIKDMINRGGENVSATELEEHLLAHPAVAAAAVVALPDPTLGELVCAVLTLDARAERSPKLKELKGFLGERGLARYKHPDRVVLRDDLPVTAVGKIDKRQLVDILSSPAQTVEPIEGSR